jgi:hypothetical protein
MYHQAKGEDIRRCLDWHAQLRFGAALPNIANLTWDKLPGLEDNRIVDISYHDLVDNTFTISNLMIVY